MRTRLYILRIVVLIAVAALAVSAMAQPCGGRNRRLSSARAFKLGPGPTLGDARSYVVPGLQFHAASLEPRAYVPAPSIFGYSYHGPISGLYANRYGYYARPCLTWTPHYDWVRHGFRRLH